MNLKNTWPAERAWEPEHDWHQDLGLSCPSPVTDTRLPRQKADSEAGAEIQGKVVLPENKELLILKRFLRYRYDTRRKEPIGKI